MYIDFYIRSVNALSFLFSSKSNFDFYFPATAKKSGDVTELQIGVKVKLLAFLFFDSSYL